MRIICLSAVQLLSQSYYGIQNHHSGDLVELDFYSIRLPTLKDVLDGKWDENQYTKLKTSSHKSHLLECVHTRTRVSD
jgi:hypothetical protein